MKIINILSYALLILTITSCNNESIKDISSYNNIHSEESDTVIVDTSDKDSSFNDSIDSNTGSNTESNFEFNLLDYDKEHIKSVYDKQYYVDNIIEVTMLENGTKKDLENLVNELNLGIVRDSNGDSCDYVIELNKNYSYEEISVLESSLNENEWLLASVINIYDNSDWHGEIPIN